MRRVRTIILSVLVVLVLMGIAFIALSNRELSVDQVKNDPERQIVESYQKTVSALQKGFSQSPLYVISESLKDGRVKVWRDNEFDASDSISIYANQDNKEYAMMFETKVGEKTDNTGLYINDQAIVLSAPHVFGDAAYGIDVKTMQQDMETSPFWNAAGVSYEDVKPTLDKLCEISNTVENGPKDPGYTEFIKTLEGIKGIARQCAVIVEEGGVLTGTEMISAINVKYTLSAEQIGQIVDVIKNWSESSIVNDLFVKEALESQQSGVISSDLLTAIKTADSVATLVVSINPKNKMIMKIEMQLTYKIDAIEEKFKISIDLGADPSSSYLREIRVSKTNETTEEALFAITYEIMDATGVYDRRFKVQYSDSSTLENIVLRFQWNKANGSYTLKTDYNGDEFSLGGKCQVTNNRLEIHTENTEEPALSLGNIHVVAEIGIPVPQTPQFSNIFKVTDEEVRKLLEVMSEPEAPDRRIPDKPENK